MSDGPERTARDARAGDKAFTGSIPEIYDRYLVPLIFEAYAQDLAARVVARTPKDVLEVACGTGVVTRALARRLPAARIVATDLNQAMIDRAAKHLSDPRVTWRQADALSLPFEDASADVVVCQFGAMFFPDRVAAYREARRVLRPGGALLFNVWDRIEVNQFVAVVSGALAALFPDDPPRFMARTPHGYHDAARIRADLAAAGFADVRVEAVAHTSRAASAREVAIGYCQGNPLRGEIEARGNLEAATAAAAAALAKAFGDGAIEGKVSALVVEGS